MKIYRMNDCDWVASNLNKEETAEWYKKEYGLDKDYEGTKADDLQTCNLDKDGQFILFENEEKIKKLDEENIIDTRKSKNYKFGDLYNADGEWFIYVSFRKAIEHFKLDENSKPMVIASTEY